MLHSHRHPPATRFARAGAAFLRELLSGFREVLDEERVRGEARALSPRLREDIGLDLGDPR